jgi:hypothetical protein
MSEIFYVLFIVLVVFSGDTSATKCTFYQNETDHAWNKPCDIGYHAVVISDRAM